MENRIIEIIDFLEDFTGASPITAKTDIYKDLGTVGDDFFELIEKYALRFKVDISTFLWCFHSEEEGQNFGSLFFKPPDARVERIPITPYLLAKFVETKKWEIDYPPHELPEIRYDMIVNQVFAFLSIFLMLFFCWKKYIA